MKIRALELTNLRRFGAKRARIDGIGDGVSVLSQPNEFGKSTFFDGLHALFFQPHRSSRAPVKALQPHSGGAPEVAVELDLPEGRFRLEKRWLSRPTARVLDATGRLIAQEDEAEAWIDRLTGQGLAGPSGLLWVRQGLLGMEPEGAGAADKSDREKALTARRDLLSSVAGEIEMMTGGRRMDQVLARVNEALAKLATNTLRPRSGGEWARATDEAEALAQDRAGLEIKVARLSSELANRAAITRDLIRLADPDQAARDQAAFDQAGQALRAAETHAEQARKAESDLRLAQLTAGQGAETIRRLEDLKLRLGQAIAAQAKTSEELARTEALTSEAAALDTTAAREQAAAVGAVQALAARLDLAQRAGLALAARDRMAGLAARLERADRQRAALDDHLAARSPLKVTRDLLDLAEKAQGERDRLALQDEARLVAVTLTYSGAARVTAAGQPIGAEGLKLRGSTALDLPGIGRMVIDPGLVAAGDIGAKLQQAQDRLATALMACGAADLAAARHAFAETGRLDAAISQARALLAELAPEGADALRTALAVARSEAGDLPGAAPDAAAAEDIAGLQSQLRSARETEERAQVHRREAEARHARLREARAASRAAELAAGQVLDAVRAEAGDPVDLAARLLHLAEAQTGLAEAETQAAGTLARLTTNAPDLETARAAVTRLASVIEGRRRDRARLESDLAGVSGSIGALADEGIEEALGDLRGREATALARAARYEREVKALARLRTALEAARREAREAYLGPVLRELDPLLSILHPGASLRIDDTSLLPVALMRDGQDEEIEILSGGTREQLAVLTRLAFARLFAQSGRSVPVILDDALVHSDDDRIEAMFTALHRVAQDQQIIVLTCRQRAFASLGGERLHAQISSV